VNIYNFTSQVETGLINKKIFLSFYFVDSKNILNFAPVNKKNVKDKKNCIMSAFFSQSLDKRLQNYETVDRLIGSDRLIDCGIIFAERERERE
jgi:hypothetical protein